MGFFAIFLSSASFLDLHFHQAKNTSTAERLLVWLIVFPRWKGGCSHYLANTTTCHLNLYHGFFFTNFPGTLYISLIFILRHAKRFPIFSIIKYIYIYINQWMKIYHEGISPSGGGQVNLITMRQMLCRKNGITLFSDPKLRSLL